MRTRNVVLSDHHESIIEQLVKSGRYQNASEVMRDGLRLIELREAREAAKLEALRNAAQMGFADLETGRFDEVTEDRLGEFIGHLGSSAATPRKTQI
jgi:antitoxin ParD1/3/4